MESDGASHTGTDEPAVAVAARSLLASGYEITGSHAQPRHLEIRCERRNAIGARVAVLLALTSESELTPQETEDLHHAARSECRSVVVVGAAPGENQLSWSEFLDALGGGVPSWRALADSYDVALLAASRNQLPDGHTGEAWRLFEELGADGLEFLFGRKVRRLGARRRGQPVSDMIAQLPDGALVVVDAKAAESAFDASWDALRPLGEYIERQKQRQRGHNTIYCALVISSAFQQDAAALSELSHRFFSIHSVPLAFVSAADLLTAVKSMRLKPQHRNALNWRAILSGGRVSSATVLKEIGAVEAERITREDS